MVFLSPTRSADEFLDGHAHVSPRVYREMQNHRTCFCRRVFLALCSASSTELGLLLVIPLLRDNFFYALLFYHRA